MSNTAVKAVPAVSVLMPAYNVERYLRQSVGSILAQTFRDFEFVIIDDGSTDRTGAMLERMAAGDARIRLIRRENKGVVPTREELWHLARADLLAIMDADDVAAPTRLEKEVAFLRAHPEVVCVSGLTRLIDAKGRWIPCPLRPPLDHEGIEALLLKGACPISNSAALVRKAAVMQVGGYDTDLGMSEDYALWLKLGEVGRLANLPDVLADYRLHNGSVSEQRTAEQLGWARLAWERALKRRGIAGVFEQTDNWRPKPTAASQHSFALRYGWWAFNGGQWKTALVYGMRAVRFLPLKREGWVLMACALLKTPRASTVD
jgi:glycosyltransferase involved in cell wall biosynthesis